MSKQATFKSAWDAFCVGAAAMVLLLGVGFGLFMPAVGLIAGDFPTLDTLAALAKPMIGLIWLGGVGGLLGHVFEELGIGGCYRPPPPPAPPPPPSAPAPDFDAFDKARRRARRRRILRGGE